MSFKAIFKNLLRRVGVVAVSGSHAAVRYIDHLPGSLFDAVLLRRFDRLDNLTFLQIGANDGRRFDPINAYVTTHAWRGVLVEPVPYNFSNLKRTYAGRPNLEFVQAAIDEQPGRRPVYHLRENTPPPVPEWAWGLASFDRERLLGAVRSLGWPEEVIQATEVPTLPWSEVWPRVPGGHCDVLVIDTEGHDVRLLRSADLRRHLPTVIHFEHAHTGAPERAAFYGDLMELGYDLCSDTGDTTAWLPAGATAMRNP